MSKQHLQGRIKVQHPHAGPCGFELADEKTGLKQICQDVTEANARRLAACWNACDALYTESLERNKPLADQIVDALNQRDELEALAKRMAFDLECLLLAPQEVRWQDTANQSLQAYRDLMDQWYPQDDVSPLGKD